MNDDTRKVVELIQFIALAVTRYAAEEDQKEKKAEPKGEATESTPIKRGRGRPRKTPVIEESKGNGADENIWPEAEPIEEEKPAPKRRGRPRKFKAEPEPVQEPVQEEFEFQENDDDFDFEIEPEEPKTVTIEMLRSGLVDVQKKFNKATAQGLLADRGATGLKTLGKRQYKPLYKAIQSQLAS